MTYMNGFFVHRVADAYKVSGTAAAGTKQFFKKFFRKSATYSKESFLTGYRHRRVCGESGHPGGLYKEVRFMFNTSHLRLKQKNILDDPQYFPINK